MSKTLLEMFQEHQEPEEEEQIIRALFPWPGGKSRSVKNILPLIPHRKVFVEPFGGSGVVLLNRRPSSLDVLNDRYAGIVAFYRCLKDKDKFQKLCDFVDLSIHAREEWIHCKQTWESAQDDVERAFRWYYMVCYSFASLGRNFGRTTSGSGGMAGKIRNRLPEFQGIHDRLKFVQIENLDFAKCMTDFDSHDTVFYVDPPYIDSDSGIYKEKFTRHNELLDLIFSVKGFVAVSGYTNPIYESRDWDNRIEWDSFVSIQSVGGDGNNKEHLRAVEERGTAKEVLWIKESK